jgi:Domain of unknown function (DUF4337)
LREVQSVGDLLSVLAPQDKAKTEALREQYGKEGERYAAEKEDISKEAKDFESESRLAGRKADRFDGGEALLEVGLVICSLTLLTKRRIYWIGGTMIGAGGIVMALTGFFLH